MRAFALGKEVNHKICSVTQRVNDVDMLALILKLPALSMGLPARRERGKAERGREDRWE